MLEKAITLQSNGIIIIHDAIPDDLEIEKAHRFQTA